MLLNEVFVIGRISYLAVSRSVAKLSYIVSSDVVGYVFFNIESLVTLALALL